MDWIEAPKESKYLISTYMDLSMKKTKNIVIVLVGVLLLVVLSLLVGEKKLETAYDFDRQVVLRGIPYGEIDLSINESEFEVAVAHSRTLKALGLSGVEELSENQGMLFLFDTEEPHGFWMNDMLISIDILWLNSEKEIVKIKENVSPDTYPETFGLEVDSRYVLELTAGVVEEQGFERGDQVEFKVK